MYKQPKETELYRDEGDSGLTGEIMQTVMSWVKDFSLFQSLVSGTNNSWLLVRESQHKQI